MLSDVDITDNEVRMHVTHTIIIRDAWVKDTAHKKSYTGG